MKKKSKVISFTEFTGVANTRDPAVLPDGLLQDCVNFYVDDSKVLIGRAGLQKVVDTPAKVLDIAKYKDKLYISCADGNIYELNGTTLTAIGTHANTGQVFSTTAMGKLWFADGGTPKYWDGTTFGELTDFIYKTETIATGDGTTTSFSYITKEYPITTNSITVSYTISGTQYTATDDGQGNITGTNLTGTVLYNSGDVNLSFSTAPDSGTDITITYSTSEVLDPQGDFVEFRQERLWFAKGDTLYFSEIRDPSNWGFIKVASQDESDISAIDQLYDKLIIFKEGKDRAIYGLSGNSNADFTVSLIAKGISTTKRAIAQVSGDLIFIDGDSLYTLKSVLQYGDVKPAKINQLYTFERGDWVLFQVPTKNVVFACRGNDGFSVNASNLAFTSLYFGVPFYCHLTDVEDVYVGGDNAVYVFANTSTDDGAEIVYSLKTRLVNMGGFKNLLLKAFSMYALGLSDAQVDIFVLWQGKAGQIGSVSVPQVALWDVALWDSAKWSEPSLFMHAIRQILYEEYFYIKLLVQGRVVISGLMLEVA